MSASVSPKQFANKTTLGNSKSEAAATMYLPPFHFEIFQGQSIFFLDRMIYENVLNMLSYVFILASHALMCLRQKQEKRKGRRA